jgi:hypothetical protein
MQHHNLFEGLEAGDLARLIHPELHVDEFKSKLGDDEDVIVLSFKVDSKDPANDLVSFIEKGYEWVLDADVSSGEMDDGSYIVFVEIDRDDQAVDHIIEMVKDLANLTDRQATEWRVRHYKGREERSLTADDLRAIIPTSPEEYERMYGNDELDQLKAAAGVKVTTKAPKNDYTESLRNLAGIIR